MDCSHIRFCDSSIYADGDCQYPLDLDQLQELFQLAAFWAQNRNHDDLKTALVNSTPIISVWDREKLIGFARATSDGIYRATIWDVVIHPDYRGMGLGSRLVETILSHPRMNRVERVYLMTTHQQRFYEKIGFESNSSVTMVLCQPTLDSLPAQEVQLQESPGG